MSLIDFYYIHFRDGLTIKVSSSTGEQIEKRWISKEKEFFKVGTCRYKYFDIKRVEGVKKKKQNLLPEPD